MRWRKRPTTSPASCARWLAVYRAAAPRWRRTCATMPSPRCSGTRIPRTAGSAVRPSSRPRRCSRRCCATTNAPGRRRRSTRCRARATRWPAAASTTNSAAASPGTASTTLGWYRISRRCCTTTRCCCAPTRTGPGGPAIRWRAGSPTRPPGFCSTTSPTAPCSPRRWTPTPMAARARPMCGRPNSSTTCWGPTTAVGPQAFSRSPRPERSSTAPRCCSCPPTRRTRSGPNACGRSC